jgi:hypothetical protein
MRRDGDDRAVEDHHARRMPSSAMPASGDDRLVGSLSRPLLEDRQDVAGGIPEPGDVGTNAEPRRATPEEVALRPRRCAC